MMRMKTASTIAASFLQHVDQRPDARALLIRRAGRFSPISWREMANDVARTVSALVGCEVKPTDRVVQISENRYEWIVLDLALQFLRAVHVPINPVRSGQQMAELISHCDPQLIVLSNADAANKLLAANGPFNSLSAGSDRVFMSWDDIHEIDREVRPLVALSQLPVSSPDEAAAGNLHELAELIEPEQLMTILYTSGTTGNPKGVMLSHANLAENVSATLKILPARSDETRLCILPLSHVFARTCDLYAWLAGGCTLVMAESRFTLFRDCQETRPTFFNGVPLLFEKCIEQLRKQGTHDQPAALRELLGGKIEKCNSGGAPLPGEIHDYFWEHGIPLLSGYGLTETSPVIAASTMAENKKGSVGKPLPGVAVRIADDGEILTKGPHVMLGYYHDAAATADVLKDGWLHTGDLGKLDEDGFLEIIGRKKEMIVTSNGHNIAPTKIESAINSLPSVLQSYVFGDEHPFLIALIVPDFSALPDACANDDVFAREQLLSMVSRQLQTFAKYEQVRRVEIVREPFTIDSGLITAKGSLCRTAIASRYRALLDAAYD